MKESARILHIVTKDEQESLAEVAVTPKDIGDKLGAFAPKDFKDKSSVMVKGYTVREDDESTQQRLNVKFYNPESQPAFMHLFAELAYRDLTVPAQGFDKYYLRFINDELRLQKLSRKPGESAVKYVDCNQDTIDKVADWIDGYQVMKVVKPK